MKDPELFLHKAERIDRCHHDSSIDASGPAPDENTWEELREQWLKLRDLEQQEPATGRSREWYRRFLKPRDPQQRELERLRQLQERHHKMGSLLRQMLDEQSTLHKQLMDQSWQDQVQSQVPDRQTHVRKVEQLERRWEELSEYQDEFLLQEGKMKEHRAKFTELAHHPRQPEAQDSHSKEGPTYLAGLNNPLTATAENTPSISVPVEAQEATEALCKLTNDWRRGPEVMIQDPVEEQKKIIEDKQQLWEEYLRTTQWRDPPTAEEFRRLQENARKAQEARQLSRAERVRKGWPIPDSPTLGAEQPQFIVAAANEAVRSLSLQAPPLGGVSRRAEETGNRHANQGIQRANAFRKRHR